MSSDYFPVISSQSTVASTRWLTEEVFKLIDQVQRDEAIYNPRHKYYFCRPYVENFWREVDQKLDKNPGASLAKWTNLRISFRREFTNYLEEQVPPCWSYFDRMFFLHPYLRKKQQTRPGDSNFQETLAQISDLSNRIDRRVIQDTDKSASSSQHNASDVHEDGNNSSSEQQRVRTADHYFDYYDDAEPNNSELDEIIDDEQQSEVTTSYPQVILETPTIHKKIKSECDEDEPNEDDYERMLEARDASVNLDRLNEISMRTPLGNTINSTTTRSGKRTQQQMRLEHLNRLQTRNYYEDLRAKRSRSADRAMGSTQPITSTASSTGHNSQRQYSATTQSAHSSTNVSFVRPTFLKATDTTNNVSLIEGSSISTTSTTSMAQQQQRQHSYHAHHSRVEGLTLANPNSLSTTTSHSNVGANSTNVQGSHQLLSPTLGAAAQTPHLDLCDCKTDPDAMFLMSLLPDIQKLNGRDRGKIKIAFQNILQDYLYPD